MLYNIKARGEIAFIWAIILRAVVDAITDPDRFLTGKEKSDYMAKMAELHRRDARAWINSKKDGKHEGSFQWYCQLIGMDGLPRLARRFIVTHDEKRKKQ